MALLNLIIFSFFLFFIADSLAICEREESCGFSGTSVRFPFGLTNDRCSYPGFNLSCNEKSQTILNLPRSGDFIVEFINYQTQQIHIRDPENCIANRFLTNFTLSGSPFIAEFYHTFSFLNCSSSNISISSLPPSSRKIYCLSNENFTVFAIPDGINGDEPSTPSCTVMEKTIDVPVMWPRWSEGDTMLEWGEPDCRTCEQSGGTCGFKDDVTLDVGCYDLASNSNSNSGGLPRSAKYGLIIGVGIPGLLCIIGFGCYLCGRVRTYSQRHHSNTQLPITFLQPTQSMSVTGLDGPTIELYPKTKLGESGRLPKPNDNTCPICLCEYEPKETLRTIPECNHYFHADCIDEWLKMNATCPVCRNSPDISSIGTPVSSSLSASSSSLSSGR